MRSDSPPARRRSTRRSRYYRSADVGSGGRLEPDLSREDVSPHRPVPDERVERIRERGGTVPLEEEVSDPREHVTSAEPDEDVPELTGRHRGDQADEADRGAGEVE